MRPLAFIVFVAIAPSSVLANDSSFGGEGADLAPLSESRVQMRSEDIVIEQIPNGGGWSIVATYRFVNHADSAVALTVGFPERRCTEEDGDCNAVTWTFRQLQTTVAGQPVTHRVGQTRPAPPWAPRIGRVHLFDVTFPTGQEVEVVHRYRMAESGNMNIGQIVHYITTTGALWNGPIEHARFTIRTRFRPWKVAFPAEYELTSFTERPGDRGFGINELVLEARDWTPQHDLRVYLSPRFFGHETARHLQPCPEPGMFRRDLEGDRTAEDLLSELSDFELRRCRNMVLAAHGYPFRRARNRRYFYREPVRTTDVFDLPDPDMRSSHPFTRFYFRPNPSWARGLLLPVELRYMRTIRQEEARRRSER